MGLFVHSVFAGLFPPRVAATSRRSTLHYFFQTTEVASVNTAKNVVEYAPRRCRFLSTIQFNLEGRLMPTINVQMFEGRTVEQKRAFAKAVTEAAAATLQCKPESVDIVFQDVKKEDWATGGKLWCD